MQDYKTLVLGASTNPNRYSYKAVERLKNAPIPVVPMGVRSGEIEGITIQRPFAPQEDIHTVTLYLGPRLQEQYFNYIVGLQPKRVIFNPGTENPKFYQYLRKEAPDVVIEVACTLVLLSIDNYKTLPTT